MAIGGRSQILSLLVDGVAPVVFNGPVAFGTLVVKSGSLVLSGVNTADTAQFGTASISGVGSTLQIGGLTLSGPTTLANTSIVITGTSASTFNGQVQVSSGSITVQQSATVTATQFELLALDGVPVATPTFINNGIVIVTAFEINQLAITGTGSYSLQGKLTLQSSSFTAGTVTLAQSTSSLVGSVSSFTAKAVSTTATSLKYVDFTVGSLTFHCQSACPSTSTNGITNSFQAVPASS
jgi:cytoskeletal protein CcmA (bactofilin family)